MRCRRTDSAPIARQVAQTRPPLPATIHIETPLAGDQRNPPWWDSNHVYTVSIHWLHAISLLLCVINQTENGVFLLQLQKDNNFPDCQVHNHIAEN